MEKINLDLFDNKIYQIKGSKGKKAEIIFVDFKYEPSEGEDSMITPDVFNKKFDLKKHTIEKLDFENIKKEIDKEFGLILSEMGEKNREYLNRVMNNPNFAEKFDINKNYMLEKVEGDILKINEFMIAKLNNASNIIATEGRIGKGQWILSNEKTYNWIVENNLFIDNLPVYINDSISDNVLIEGRKNMIEQPGLVCAIYVDEDNNIIFEKDEETNEISIFFNIIDIGFFPHKHFMKINITNG